MVIITRGFIMPAIENTKAAAWIPDDVRIPAALFRAAISLLEDLEVEDHDSDTIQLYGYVLHSLNTIKANIDFKESFVRFFCSEEGHRCFTDHMNGVLLSNGEVPF
jgi:hypothetical protein